MSNPPESFVSPGHSGAKFFVSSDKRLIIKSLSSEEVALLHQILQQYYAVSQREREMNSTLVVVVVVVGQLYIYYIYNIQL